MGFDLSTAQPVADSGGFDLSTATPVGSDEGILNRRTLNPGEYDPTSSAYKQRYGAGATNESDPFAEGMGSFYAGAGLGAKQLGAQVINATQQSEGNGSPLNPQAMTEPFTGDTAAEKRKFDALNTSPLFTAGQVGAAAPLAFLPGANSYGGAAVLGGSLGALQPTTEGESRLLNTATGAALGPIAQKVGNVAGNWATGRASQPFMGWNLNMVDRTLAQAVGSDAPALTPQAIGEAKRRLTGIFRAVRSPSVETTLGQPSVSALQQVSPANPSARAIFDANPNVTDFLDHVTSGRPVSAQQLGSISTALRQDASTQLTSEGGNREVGLALKALKEHVDDVIGGTIRDPGLAAAYTAARPQYGTLMDVIDNPTLLNASTGRVNATAFGKYLQRNDPEGYSTGLNKSPLYQAARWGQATGEGKGAPNLTLGNLGIPWLAYHGLNNPLSRAAGGAISRAGAPIAPYAGLLTQPLAVPAVPALSRGLLETAGP